MVKKFTENLEINSPHDNSPRVHLEVGSKIRIWNSSKQERVTIHKGGLVLRDSNGQLRMEMQGNGPLFLLDANNKIRARMDSDGNLRLSDGNIRLSDASQKLRVEIKGSSGQLYFRDANNKARAHMGSNGNLRLWDASQKQRVEIQGTHGKLYLRDANGKTKAYIGSDGNIRLSDASQKKRVEIQGTHGRIRLYDSNQQEKITIDGNAGDIFLKNADCAEEFDISDADLEAGTVMVLGNDEKLEACNKPYDKKVVGIISGAGEYAPGIVLDKKNTNSGRMPVALMGKVYCNVDATISPIEVGDLLTSSSTLGYAMKASDPLKAFGSVIGKALRGIKKSKGQIPVLVTLQ